eukprot:scaffold84545_cov30-Tisochrysis_lutea.AAC.4
MAVRLSSLGWAHYQMPNAQSRQQGNRQPTFCTRYAHTMRTPDQICVQAAIVTDYKTPLAAVERSSCKHSATAHTKFTK